MFYQFVKVGCLALYLSALIAPFLPALQPASDTLRTTSIVFFALHLGEYLMVKKQLDALGQPKLTSFIQTMLFGLGYWMPYLRASKAQG